MLSILPSPANEETYSSHYPLTKLSFANQVRARPQEGRDGLVEPTEGSNPRAEDRHGPLGKKFGLSRRGRNQLQEEAPPRPAAVRMGIGRATAAPRSCLTEDPVIARFTSSRRAPR